ncbi:MAG: hypothetical protein LQ338_002444 [Usnochroma carphineum]|nr:MAG: hypothetical protein LQ338_002444 [Usnochroma carphineum]
MAPLEKAKAKRRWTLNRSRDIAEESPDEDYGEEILPTIDRDALATLPPADQEQFKKMRKKDRKNVIARWRREGRAVPEISASNSSESSSALYQHSSAPQLPELQMDVTRETFGGAFDNARQPSPVPQNVNVEQSLGASRSGLREGPQPHQDLNLLTSSHHNQPFPHLPVEPQQTQQTQHTTQTPFIAQASTESDDADDASLWLRIMDSDQYARGRRRTQGPLQDVTSETGESSSLSNIQETVEQRRLRELRHANVVLQDVNDERDLEYARFHGIGPVPPGLALAGNAPSASERTHAQTVTNVDNVIRSTGQVDAHNAIAVARQAATPDEAALYARETLFVRPRGSAAQEIAPVNAWRGEARAQGMQLSPPTTANSEGQNMPNLAAMTGNDGTEGLQEGMGNVKISPMKRMAKKVGNGIKGLFKGKSEKPKPRAPERPISRVRLHDGARVGTATAVSMTPVTAPQPTRHIPRPPPPLQPATTASASRTGSPRRRTTRAMMENYD